jgi:hypothetical protein
LRAAAQSESAGTAVGDGSVPAEITAQGIAKILLNRLSEETKQELQLHDK